MIGERLLRKRSQCCFFSLFLFCVFFFLEMILYKFIDTSYTLENAAIAIVVALKSFNEDLYMYILMIKGSNKMAGMIMFCFYIFFFS